MSADPDPDLEELVRRLRHDLALTRAEADELARGNELLREALDELTEELELLRERPGR
jgi:hypothetical protein